MPTGQHAPLGCRNEKGHLEPSHHLEQHLDLTVHTPPIKLAQLVSDMTGGNFVIKVEGAEKHKAPLEILDMVKGGQYEMGHTASYYWKGRDATTTLFTTVPFGMTSSEQGA